MSKRPYQHLPPLEHRPDGSPYRITPPQKRRASGLKQASVPTPEHAAGRG